MSTYTIEGEWSGYTSSQRHVVHREHTRSKKRVDAIKGIGHGILYTDGTWLHLHVREGKHDKPINGYGKLIDQCIKAGTNRVADLERAERT